MRGYIDNQRPTYQELLEGASERMDPSDELVGAHLAAERRGFRTMLMLSAILVVAMALGAVFLLGGAE